MALRVMIIESDAVLRRALQDRLSGNRRIDVTGAFSNLTDAFHAVEHQPPNLVLAGAGFLRFPEFDVMELLFRSLSVRLAIVATEAQQRQLARGRANRERLNCVAPDCDAEALFQTGLRERPDQAAAPLNRCAPARASQDRSDRILLIGSSTGGVDALMKVLSRFPADCPPTLIVQHIGAPFGEGLAGLLDRAVAPKVRLALERERLTRGTVLLAPAAHRHLVLDGRSGLTARLVDGPKVSGHRPSVDALFQSALPVASRVTAAILTGMGRDGAEGITALRAAGAMTIGQDRETSLVYGMPGVAREMGGIVRELPLTEIGAALVAAPEMQRA